MAQGRKQQERLHRRISAYHNTIETPASSRKLDQGPLGRFLSGGYKVPGSLNRKKAAPKGTKIYA